MQWSVVTLVPIRSLPYTLACTAKSASGMAGGFVGRQPVTNKKLWKRKARWPGLARGKNQGFDLSKSSLNLVTSLS